MSITELTSNNFDQVLEDNALLVIDFWAQWCGPCKVFTKVMEHVASEYSDFTFASVDVDEEKALAEEFSVRSVPFVMIMRDRVVVYADSGALTVDGLRELLDQTKALDSAELQQNPSE